MPNEHKFKNELEYYKQRYIQVKDKLSRVRSANNQLQTAYNINLKVISNLCERLKKESLYNSELSRIIPKLDIEASVRRFHLKVTLDKLIEELKANRYI